MTADRLVALAACPFCGGEASFCHECCGSPPGCHRILCPNCGDFDLSGDNNPETVAELQEACAAKWNTRALAQSAASGWEERVRGLAEKWADPRTCPVLTGGAVAYRADCAAELSQALAAGRDGV